jgi:hypothetical protein
MKIGTGEGCYARASIFYDFGAFGELAISTFLVCTFGSPEHDGWCIILCIHATRDRHIDNS